MSSTFEQSTCNTEKKLANFPKYIRRQTMARFLVQHELFKRQLKIKGSIVECGVHHGGGVMAWAKLSTTLEPYNYHRKIIGFDTFEGFPSVHELDKKRPEETSGVDLPPVCVGSLKEDYDVIAEMEQVVNDYDENRFINHIPKVELVKGDANITIPQYIEDNQHLLVSLLYLDFDIYEPTVTALKHLLPRMPKGAILAFDEVNNKYWPGETMAMLESLNLQDHRLESFEFEPNISFIQL